MYDVPLNTNQHLKSQDSYWNESRREIHAWLNAKAPELAALYEGSLKILFTKDFPGKIRFLGHAVREIRNRLPDFISGPGTSSRIDYVHKINKLAISWESAKLPMEVNMPANMDQTEPSMDMSVPKSVYTEIGLLLKEHKERKSGLDAAIRLFEEITPENKGSGDVLKPAIVQWREITEWFMKNTHVPISGNSIQEDELLKKFEIFDYTLGSLIRGFFKTSRSLDEILEDTNS